MPDKSPQTILVTERGPCVVAGDGRTGCVMVVSDQLSDNRLDQAYASTDVEGLRQQVRYAVQQHAPIDSWLRDEEAAGSNPATPTKLTGHLRSSQVAFSIRYSSKVQQRHEPSCFPSLLSACNVLASETSV
jgi:hypothetical protein